MLFSPDRFPLNNPELLKKWIEFTDRGPNWKPSRWSSICSRHFVSADFRDFLTRKCLKKSAVPSVMIRKNSNSSGSDANFPGAGQMIGKNGNEYRSNQVIHPIIVVKSLGNRDKETRPLEGATCSLCGYYQDDTDHNGSLNLHENIADTMLKKCFPTTLLRHDLESNNICGECAQLLRLFSEFVDKVIAYQKELQSRTTAEKEIGGSASGSEVNYSGHRSTAIGTAGVGCKEMATNNVFIKQEPINVKQEIVDISGKRSTVHSDSSYSVFSQTAPAVSLPFLNHHRDRVGNYTSSFCSFCDRIFVNNYELESHICNTNRHQRREISAATNNNCEIMEIITLNNSISYIDLAEDDTFQPITNHAMKVEHLSDFERRERIESDHAYAKRIEVFNPKLKEEINYDSTDSYESNIEVYEPSQNDLMVDLSNNNSGNESDFNDTSLFTMPKTMMITVSGLHTCDRCDVRFETAQALHEHCRTMHALKNKVCSVCSADFKSIHDYLVHKNKMHAIGHQCSQCRRSFAFKHALSNHKRFTCSPGTSDQFYSCKYCGKRFRNRMSMNDHCKMCSASILNEKTKEGGIDQKVPLPSLEVEVPMIAETSTVTTAKSNPVIPAMPAITRAPLFHTVPIIASQMTVTALGNPNNIVPEPKKMLACEVCGSRFSKRFNLVSKRNLFIFLTIIITKPTILYSSRRAICNAINRKAIALSNVTNARKYSRICMSSKLTWTEAYAGIQKYLPRLTTDCIQLINWRMISQRIDCIHLYARHVAKHSKRIQIYASTSSAMRMSANSTVTCVRKYLNGQPA